MTEAHASLDALGIAWRLGATVSFVLLNGFFVAARELQSSRQHCAVVLDEHGTAVGLAFREDALEEIVGPLGDEFDFEDQERGFVESAEGVFEIGGRMSLPELQDRLDFELTDDEHEDEDTLGGHVTARLGRMPKDGDTVQVGPYVATVIDTSNRRVQRVRMVSEKQQNPEASDAPDESREH